jgi:hypothetical protein
VVHEQQLTVGSNAQKDTMQESQSFAYCRRNAQSLLLFYWAGLAAAFSTDQHSSEAGYAQVA